MPQAPSLKAGATSRNPATSSAARAPCAPTDHAGKLGALVAILCSGLCRSRCARGGATPHGALEMGRDSQLSRGAPVRQLKRRGQPAAQFSTELSLPRVVRFAVCGHRCARALGRNGVPSQQKPQRGICTSPLLAMFMAGRCAANMYMCSSWRLACFGSAFSVSTLLTDTALEGLAHLHDVDSCGVPNAHKASSI